MMNLFIKMIKQEKREKMMIDMMPLMMDGIDMNELMPKMCINMLSDLTAEDAAKFFIQLLKDKEKITDFLSKIQSANLMQNMMMITYKSRYGLDETVEKLKLSAEEYGWNIPQIRDLQEEYQSAGIKEMTRLKTLYFCNPENGYSIIKNDDLKPMSVLMPMGVTVYEKADGAVEIAAMNLKMMSYLFGGVVAEVLQNGYSNLVNSIKAVSAKDKN